MRTKTDFSRGFQIPAVWAPIPALFPLFSRCSGPIPAVFPLFSRYFPTVFCAFWCFQGFAVKTHNKTQFSKILSKTVVSRPKRTKKQNFQQFCSKQWFCGQNAQKKQNFQIFSQTRPKQTRKTNFSEILPKTGQNGQKDKIFRNLALKRLKCTKKHIFQILCAKQCVCSQNTQTNPNFQKSWPEQRFAVKACKTNKIFGIKAPKLPKPKVHASELRFPWFFGQITVLHVF